MTYHTITDIFEALQHSHAAFVAAVSNLNEAQEQHRAGDDQWTIAEIAEHIGIVNGGFLRLTHKLVRQAEAKGHAAPADLALGHVALDANGVPAPPFQAPEQVRPKGGVPVALALPGIRETLARLIEVRPRIAAVDCSEEKFPHPAFGPMSLYQWLILLAEHQDRHRSQVERIKAAPGFPQ